MAYLPFFESLLVGASLISMWTTFKPQLRSDLDTQCRQQAHDLLVFVVSQPVTYTNPLPIALFIYADSLHLGT